MGVCSPEINAYYENGHNPGSVESLWRINTGLMVEKIPDWVIWRNSLPQSSRYQWQQTWRV